MNVSYKKNQESNDSRRDDNTKFFHSINNWKRRSNGLKGVMKYGRLVEDPNTVKEEVKCFFEKKFKESDDLNLNLDGVAFNSIGREDNEIRVARFSKFEIKQAIHSV